MEKNSLQNVISFTDNSPFERKHALIKGLVKKHTVSREDNNVTLIGRWVNGPYDTFTCIGNQSIFEIIDVSGSDVPVSLDQILNPFINCGTFVSGNYVYMADKYESLRIINVTNPISQFDVEFYNIDDQANDVYVEDSYAIVADKSTLRIINVSNSSLPREVGFYDIGNNAWDVLVVYSNACVVNTNDGLYIIHNGSIIIASREFYNNSSKKVVLFQNYPNPFNPTTIINYTVPNAGYVELGIYNTLSQKVSALMQFYQAVGQYRVQWDGQDARGKPVAFGTYIYQLKAKDFIQLKKWCYQDKWFN